MKKVIIGFVLNVLIIIPAYAANHALGRPLGQQNYQDPFNQARPTLNAEERAFIEKEACAYRLLNTLSQPTPEELATQTLAQSRAALYANATLYPQRRLEALREAELAREINRTSRLENLWWAITENSLIKLVAFGTVTATSILSKWWYADKIAAKKKQATELANLQGTIQLQAAHMQRIREGQQLQLNQTQILAGQQQLLNNFAATTDDDKKMLAALKTKFKTELSQHFGIKQIQPEPAADQSAPQAYIILPPAAKNNTAQAKLATPSAPAAA